MGIFSRKRKNVFNEINRIGMLWAVCHLWPSIYRFVLQFYCHWLLLVFLNRNGTNSFLHSREGVKQWDPLENIAYGIDILPLIKKIKWEIPEITQPRYDGDARTLVMFARIETDFNSLTRQGLGHGYHPETYKSVLIMNP